MVNIRAAAGFAFVVVTVVGCASSAPPPKPLTVEIPAPSADSAEPSIAEPAVALRLVDTAPYGIEVHGHMLALGVSREEVESALGPPLRVKDYPIDDSATGESTMGGTTYLSYEDPGMSVRTKKGIVEGFYIYIAGAAFDGMVLKPARPKLPHNIPLDATPERIVYLLGEPDERDAFALMNWYDLHYFRGNALIEYHFDKGTFNSVKVEIASLTPRKKSQR